MDWTLERNFTCTGVAESAAEAVPSWLRSFFPQQLTVLSANTMHACE